MGKSANVKNNQIKLSGFRFDLTRLLHGGKFLNPTISFAVFYDQPYPLITFSAL